MPSSPNTSLTTSTTNSTNPSRRSSTSNAPSPPSTPDPTLPLPRILCLHGGGTNTPIFRLQLRSFLSHKLLTSRFRLVFADAPVVCAEGVGVHPVYSDMGPYKRWFRWLEAHEEIGVREARNGVWSCIRRAMEGDDKLGGTGEWVGVLGFSQGAKLAGSLLYEVQMRSMQERLGMEGEMSGRGDGEERHGEEDDEDYGHDGWKLPTTFKFGLFFAGRAPLASLSPLTSRLPWLQSPGGLPESASLDSVLEYPEMRLSIPTIHVHGLKDEGLDLHRQLMDRYCAPGTTWLVEWQGTHRLPWQRRDVERVVDAVMEVADEYGIPSGMGFDGEEQGWTMMG